ncbi:hypothetical protein ASF53_00630 [Methylobacterium sp. Leaf123]|uniref:hypothetical protein n=1 Tax=Methylobacterium sp. Leaf123 TaxID=1736264 RepID=UPI0006FD5279|nr:hypothetical protein [Methylobacterium sp. Leaf123]KQQ31773.1 hypothetical protein ASF53_00630 [Methylobacterium sp. Leaf123]
MIDWLRRLFGRDRPSAPSSTAWKPPLPQGRGESEIEAPAPSVAVWEPAPQPPQPRSEAEIDAVEAALEGLIAAGLRLGPHYDGQPRRSVARTMAAHPEFAAGGDHATLPLTQHSPEALSIDILWSYRALADGIEDEFANATIFEDHCYDGADADTYRALFARLIAVAGVWTGRGIAVARVPGLGPYGHGFRVAFETEPPIPPLTFPADKNFDWSLLEQLDASRPAGETRRFRVAADGGAGLVLFLDDAEAQAIALRLGWGPDDL